MDKTHWKKIVSDPNYLGEADFQEGEEKILTIEKGANLLSEGQRVASAYELDKRVNKDHVATPRYVVESIYELLNIQQYERIWFPFNHYDSEFKLKADELKLQYKATHIFDDLGNDFFKTDPPSGCDMLISNPPFSQQNAILARTFDLIDRQKVKACCLLLPLATLETPARAEMYQRHADKLSLIVFKKRIKFIGHEGSFNKACCWICYNAKSLKPGQIYWI